MEKLDNDFITQPIDTTGWVCDGSYTGTANERETKKAWCASSVPTDGQLKKTMDALDKIKQRNEKCREIAEKGKELLQHHGLRYYPDGTVPNGGWGGQSFGVLLSDRWLTYINNSGTVVDADSTKVKINLQFALTHEIEHAMGRSHIEGSKWRTPHAVQCSGL